MELPYKMSNLESSLVSTNFAPPPDLTRYIAKAEDQYAAGGGFGDVYRCWCYYGSPKEVAVKAFRFAFAINGDANNKSAKMFRRELGIWRRLNHPNVVPFLGIAYGFGMRGAMSLVSLWMQNGSLQHFLEKHGDNLSVEPRLQFLLDTANGLHYLHSLPIIHGDLNCNNVLLDADCTARLADFGYASLVGNIPEALTYLQRSTVHPGALRWSPPEQIDTKETFNRTTKSDIYSFGCVLSGKQPWSEIRGDMAVVLQLAKGCKPCRPESRTLDDSHWHFIQKCWSRIEERPAAEVVIFTIDNFLRKYSTFRPLHDSLLSPSSQGQDDLRAEPTSLFHPTSVEGSSIHVTHSSYHSAFGSASVGPSVPPVAPSSIPGVPPSANQSLPPLVYYSHEEGRGHGHQRDREREPPLEVRDPKRMKTERMQGDNSDHYRPLLLPKPLRKLPMSPLPPLWVGTTLRRSGKPTPSGATKQPSTLSSLAPVNNTSGGGQFPGDLGLGNILPLAGLTKRGNDWFATFNPKVKRVLDVALVHTLKHDSVVCCVRFSVNGRFLATGCNFTAQIYDIKTGAKTCVLFHGEITRTGDMYIRSVCFSPDGKYLATGADDKQIRIWDIAKKRIRHVLDGHRAVIYSLGFSPDGRFVVSGSGDETVRVWDMVDSSSKAFTLNDPDPLGDIGQLASVAISPNGQLVGAGSTDAVIRIWDVVTGSLVGRLSGHGDSVYSVAFTRDGKGLLSGSVDKTLKYWNLTYGAKDAANGPGKQELKEASQCTMDFTGHRDYVMSVAVSHDGRWVVSGSKDHGVWFWDSHTATMECVLQGHKNPVLSVDCSPVGNILATGGGDWDVRI
ncbi:WD40-repeat-containing domain protein, partial [Boletus edulis]